MIIEYCATRLIPKIKIDFCPNKYRLILLSCPLQLISIDSRSPSGLRLTKLQNGDQDVKFQFTQPKRAATCAVIANDVVNGVSIHAAQAGCDLRKVSGLITPDVSIHAAQAGCDMGKWLTAKFEPSFNSRSPSGLRRASSKTKLAKMTVSIHAAQAGCDTLATSQGSTQVSFNSRSPSGLRQVVAIQLIYSADVSIHAAQAGCDYGGISRTFLRSVSIHAAQAGCDDGVLACCTLAVVSIHAAQAGCDGCCKDTTKKRFSQRINRESPY